MTLPTNERCREVVRALKNEPNLNEFERGFVTENQDRAHWSTPQKIVVARLIEAFEV